MTHLEALQGKKLPECTMEEITKLFDANIPMIIGGNKYDQTSRQIKINIIKALQRDFKDKTIQSIGLAFKMARSSLISIPEYPSYTSRLISSVFYSYFSYLHKSNIRIDDEEEDLDIERKNHESYLIWKDYFNENDISKTDLSKCAMIYKSLYMLGDINPTEEERTKAKEKAKKEWLERKQKQITIALPKERRMLFNEIQNVKDGNKKEEINNIAKRIILCKFQKK